MNELSTIVQSLAADFLANILGGATDGPNVATPVAYLDVPPKLL
ncbi:MAG TPA: hypothetical protein VHU84_03555 [Lacipirellulaceae bacterium]|nr:hypothetical protein [Lacipirellulaceae bacterium]